MIVMLWTSLTSYHKVFFRCNVTKLLVEKENQLIVASNWFYGSLGRLIQFRLKIILSRKRQHHTNFTAQYCTLATRHDKRIGSEKWFTASLDHHHYTALIPNKNSPSARENRIARYSRDLENPYTQINTCGNWSAASDISHIRNGKVDKRSIEAYRQRIRQRSRRRRNKYITRTFTEETTILVLCHHILPKTSIRI